MWHLDTAGVDPAATYLVKVVSNNWATGAAQAEQSITFLAAPSITVDSLVNGASGVNVNWTISADAVGDMQV